MNLNSYIYENEPTYKKHLFTLENILKFLYILLVSFEYHVCRLGIAASILGAIRRKSIKTEFTMNILYLINIYQFKSIPSPPNRSLRRRTPTATSTTPLGFP